MRFAVRLDGVGRLRKRAGKRSGRFSDPNDSLSQCRSLSARRSISPLEWVVVQNIATAH